MKTISKLMKTTSIALVAVGLSVGGFSTVSAQLQDSENLDELNQKIFMGNSFNRYLAEAYRHVANFEEQREFDFKSPDYFAKKGLEAVDGALVLPEYLGDWNLDEADKDTLRVARTQLVNALNRGGRDGYPLVAARTQVAFDCWVEQQAEDRQSRHIAFCQEQFYNGLEIMTGTRVADTTIFVQPTVTFQTDVSIAPVDTFLFNLDSARLTPTSSDQLNLLAAAIRQDGINRRIRVVGHTDREGTSEYNYNLSLERAYAVSNGLRVRGIPGSQITVNGVGETQPKNDGSSETDRAMNRRVVVYYE